jgi:hypothetical protein
MVRITEQTSAKDVNGFAICHRINTVEKYGHISAYVVLYTVKIGMSLIFSVKVKILML